MHPPPDGFPPHPANPRRFPHVPPHFGGGCARALLPFLALALAGCATSQPKTAPTIADEGKALFGSSPASDPAKPGADPAQSWAIVIVAFRGPDQDADAAAAAERHRDPRL